MTLAVFIRGRCDAKDVPGYMIAQVLGGLAAAAVSVMLVKDSAPGTAAELKVVPALIVEFLYTFALAYVVLNVATSRDTAGNSFYGLAIGSTVLVGAFAVGAVSGGAFNPAVAISAALFKLIPIGQVWIHLAADFAGGAVAGLVFKAINPDDK